MLDALVASLRPGGWLLLEEGEEFAVQALATGLYREGFGAFTAGLAQAGVDCGWARQLPSLLQGRGLIDVRAESDVPIFEGASPSAQLLQLSVIQARELAVAAGATPDQLDEWHALLDEPGRWFPGFAMVAAWGRRAE